MSKRIARVEPAVTVIVGVDTHKHVHVAVAVDRLGARLGSCSVPANRGGYAELVAWARTLGTVEAFGIEGTGSYGVGLASFVRRHAVRVVEVNHCDRRKRRNNGKSDTIDAEMAARSVLAGIATAVPKSADGAAEMVRQIKIARDTAVKARSSAVITLKTLIVNAPAELREALEPLTDRKLIECCAELESWGTDGVRVFTAEDGWVWTFAAVDHWNAECVGWHVCKVGSRFAALEPIAQGLGRLYGSVEADVARGLALRMDHGSQYLSDHFLNQVRYWGIHPSFGLLEEPETNGVVERWNRTLKEQAIYGRVFHNLAEVRAAVAAFVERYNQNWRLEKLAYHTPNEAREQYELRQAA